MKKIIYLYVVGSLALLSHSQHIYAMEQSCYKNVSAKIGNNSHGCNKKKQMKKKSEARKKKLYEKINNLLEEFIEAQEKYISIMSNDAYKEFNKQAFEALLNTKKGNIKKITTKIEKIINTKPSLNALLSQLLNLRLELLAARQQFYFQIKNNINNCFIYSTPQIQYTNMNNQIEQRAVIHRYQLIDKIIKEVVLANKSLDSLDKDTINLLMAQNSLHDYITNKKAFPYDPDSMIFSEIYEPLREQLWINPRGNEIDVFRLENNYDKSDYFNLLQEIKNIQNQEEIKKNVENNPEEETLENSLEEKTLENSLEEKTLENSLEEKTLENSLEEKTLENNLEEKTLENNLEEKTLENNLEDKIQENNIKKIKNHKYNIKEKYNLKSIKDKKISVADIKNKSINRFEIIYSDKAESFFKSASFELQNEHKNMIQSFINTIENKKGFSSRYIVNNETGDSFYSEKLKNSKLIAIHYSGRNCEYTKRTYLTFKKNTIYIEAFATHWDGKKSKYNHV
ncbi:hypothetical protein [Francisella sp. TX07-6608]|uniref:hypothetical protein n=1 Tax=Francisella sp. TX07-6608 TaxID=573568 RepID=UPI0008F98785|nr:hypothetical protein [Francisella sp. TX07-6608]OIN85136.1 hypothetical protein KX00_2305 [Francisella sp. TX07-6608]